MSGRWWVHLGGKNLGPFEPRDAADLPGMTSETLVCPEGGETWAPARDVDEIMAAIRKKKASSYTFISVTEEKKSFLERISGNPRLVKSGAGLFVALFMAIIYWYVEIRTGIDLDPGLGDQVEALRQVTDMGTQSELQQFSMHIRSEPPECATLTPVGQVPGLHGAPERSFMNSNEYLYQCIGGRWRVVVAKADGGFSVYDSFTGLSEIATLDQNWKPAPAPEKTKAGTGSEKPTEEAPTSPPPDRGVSLARLSLAVWYVEHDEKYPVAAEWTPLEQVEGFGEGALPPDPASVAGILYRGGPRDYELKRGSGGEE